MTHFSVLVLTRAEPGDTTLDRIMAPFREFDGGDDAFVKDVDVTEKTRADYDSLKFRRFRSPDGTYHEPSSDYYREPTPEERAVIGSNTRSGSKDGITWEVRNWGDRAGDPFGYSARVLALPDGWVDEDVPASKLMSFAEFITFWTNAVGVAMGEALDYEGAHATGYFLTDADGTVTKVIRRTNPEGYWDWFEVGGRFGGALRVINPDDAESAEENGYNVCQRRELDLPSMMKERRQGRRKWLADIAGKIGISLERLEELLHVDREAQARWMALPDPRPRGEEYAAWIATQFDDHELLKALSRASYETPRLSEGQTIEQFIDDVAPITAHAYIKDGKWFQRGKVGMFAMMHEQTMSDAEWRALITKEIEDLPQDHWITVIDCHV
ncbi:hypothetical protein G6L37_04560 [Agrobacterium rubi]|nr:hypothetical protein [Agrobacterium rubi]NTF24625.1 hypothetical protein [Agrobacterium rubi]